jgi:hypothetical protein
MDWDRAEKRGHDFSMKYSVMIDGQMFHFVYIVSPNRWKDSLLWISTATGEPTGKKLDGLDTQKRICQVCSLTRTPWR